MTVDESVREKGKQMNPCVVKVDGLAGFEVSSHEYAVTVADTFQWRRDLAPMFGGETMRHNQCPRFALDGDACLSVDRSFVATFGLHPMAGVRCGELTVDDEGIWRRI